MSIKQGTIASAVAALLALGIAATGTAQTTGNVKCYGVAKAGKNDCAANGHSCAGKSKIDGDPAEWKSMTAARCEKLRGNLAPPTGDAGARQPVTNPPIIVDE